MIGRGAIPQTHSTLNRSQTVARVIVGKSNATKVSESENLELVVVMRGKDQKNLYYSRIFEVMSKHRGRLYLDIRPLVSILKYLMLIN